jgi:hypothetical protein
MFFNTHQHNGEEGKGKNKVGPRTGHSSTLSLTPLLDGVRGQRQTSRFTPGKEALYLLYRREGSRAGLDWCRISRTLRYSIPEPSSP